MIAGESSVFRTAPIPEPELTPAASEKLNQNMEYLRLQILREIARQYSGTGHKARASDVESAVKSINLFDSAPRIVSRTALLAIFLAGASLLFEIWNQAKRSDAAWLISGVSVLVGITSGTAIVVIIQEVKRRRRVSIAALQEFIRTFSSLEDSMRNHAGELLGPIAETVSLGRIISAVELLQLWTPEDSQAFRRLLAVRNSIVYEDKRVVPPGAMIASEFSQIARLSSLLEEPSRARHGKKIRELSTNRAALSFEERVTNALRRSGVSVSSGPKDSGYDILAGQSDCLKRIVIKYRRSGLLTVNDVSGVVERAHSSVPTIVVTNAAISPYVNDYLELTQSEKDCSIRVIHWSSSKDTRALLNALSATTAGNSDFK